MWQFFASAPSRPEAQARTFLGMAQCEVCGNDYDKSFEVIAGGKKHVFDSFECAIHALAPNCPHCNCRIIGHGVEEEGKIFCCVHCARADGRTELKDRA
jgi:nitrite reductase/ring-hydroxylating ferredoxin subunit